MHCRSPHLRQSISRLVFATWVFSLIVLTAPVLTVASASVNISNTQPAKYVWETLQTGTVVFVDRSFEYTSIPPFYNGMAVLRTGNVDKFKTGSNFISFVIDEPATVYVAYDVRITSEPGWLSSWINTGDEIDATDTTRRIYRKDFSAGTVKLGGNYGSSNSSMYTVLVSSQQGELPTVGKPSITPNGGTFSDSVEVTLSSTTSDAVIYYTLDGSKPDSSSTLYSTSFTLTSSATLKAIGLRGGYNDSSVASAQFTITQNTNEPPVLNSVGNQTVEEGQTLTFEVMASDPDGGSHPELSATNLPSGGAGNATFTDNGSGKGTFHWVTKVGDADNYPNVTFIATDAADSSLSDSKTITITVEAQSGGGGGGGSAGSVNISNTQPAKYVWETLQTGTVVFVDRSFEYTSIPPFYNGMAVLRTGNVDKFKTGSNFISFVIDEPATVYVAYDVRITSEPGWLSSWINTGDEIDATDTTRRIYRKDFSAGTVKLGGNYGSSNSSMYTVLVSSQHGELPTVGKPSITPNGGTFSDSVEVTLSSTTSDAVIYYTLDGSKPDSSSTLYSTSFTLTSSATLKAIGLRGGYNDSSVASAQFTITQNTNEPPVLNSVGNQTVEEGQTLTFEVMASDPDGGSHPELSATNLPSGGAGNATFTDNGSGKGTFHWVTKVGDADNYPNVTFIATDAADSSLSDSKTITITVEAQSGGGGGGGSAGSVNISNTQPAKYVWETLQTGTVVFVDRSFEYTSIPPFYNGMAVLRTGNVDKFKTGSNFISFVIDEPATVYVAYDVRITSEPGWLSSWINTGDEIDATDTTRRIYRKDFSAGTVKLGGNYGSSNSSMYTVMVASGDGSAGGGGGTTGTAILSWTPPTISADGSALDDLAGYNIYYGTSSGDYPNVITINNPGISAYVVENLAPNSYFFAVTAFDDLGNESDYSNEESKLIN